MERADKEGKLDKKALSSHNAGQREALLGINCGKKI